MISIKQQLITVLSSSFLLKNKKSLIIIYKTRLSLFSALEKNHKAVLDFLETEEKKKMRP